MTKITIIIGNLYCSRLCNNVLSSTTTKDKIVLSMKIQLNLINTFL